MTTKFVLSAKNFELVSKFVKPLIFSRESSHFACETVLASNACLFSNRRSFQNKFGKGVSCVPKFGQNLCGLSTSAGGGNDGEKKLTIFQRFKLMYKEYWYVLLPVHVATSACWLGGFYYMAIRFV